jgi:hypothetical protein
MGGYPPFDPADIPRSVSRHGILYFDGFHLRRVSERIHPIHHLRRKNQ